MTPSKAEFGSEVASFYATSLFLFKRDRQHKSNLFFLYTSGCLNLTQGDFEDIAQERNRLANEGGMEGVLLCEVSKKANTCLCTDSSLCNNVSIPSPFSEFDTSTLFYRLRFQEMLHFRMFIPDEPVLRHSDIDELDRLLSYYIPEYTKATVTSSTSFLYVWIFSRLFLFR
ncbi:unnamed protein product [Cylicocyclus nassatus]|uniref:Uncharacterized protein n=1 Tax=Cylicocyclus nassatus TaxID=53992 RepID=A0AA36MI20_CYLNA|nr:unnamed protein product [Cylicocyclus nassatus]